MATLRERAEAKLREQNKMDTTTTEEATKLFEQAQESAVSTAQEVKKSDSGAESVAQNTVEAIYDDKDTVEYPKGITDVLNDEDVKPSTAIKAIKAYVKAIRKAYSTDKVQVKGFSFKTSASEKIMAIADEVDKINEKLDDFDQINREVGSKIYNLEKEAERLVATNAVLLGLLVKSSNKVI
jgi:hypothetical protein